MRPGHPLACLLHEKEEFAKNDAAALPTGLGI